MESIKLRAHVGDDGIVQIQLPQNAANQDLELVIVFQPIVETSPQTEAKTPEEIGCSRNFSENVIGSWEGEPLERPEQLPSQNRKEIQWFTFSL